MTTPMKRPHFVDVARVTIEFDTPFRISGGDTNGLTDMEFITDMNGLPTLPGTSIAGVLRHAYARHHGATNPDKSMSCKDLFGFQESDRGQASRIHVSWGCVHNSANQPQEGRIKSDDLKDAVLKLVQDGLVRDHVRLSHQGVAADRAKYDETVVCAGSRFTFELTLFSWKPAEREELNVLLQLLQSPLVRLGGASRRGMGSFRVHEYWQSGFDLSDPAGRAGWASWPVSLAQKPGVPATPGSKLTPPVETLATADLTLTPESFWMIGGGIPHRKEHEITKVRRDKPEGDPSGRSTATAYPDFVDRVPYTEQRIIWENNKGTVTANPLHVLPGSAIKGALRHRTLFHLLATTGELYADSALSTAEWDDAVERLDAKLGPLFGQLKSGEEGKAGCVFIDDVYLTADPKYGMVQHVSLDRFTQGPMDGLLFAEAPLFKGGSLRVKVSVDVTGVGDNGAHFRALRLAIEDLCEGRLALGAHAARGYGYFEGTAKWKSEKGSWDGGAV